MGRLTRLLLLPAAALACIASSASGGGEDPYDPPRGSLAAYLGLAASYRTATDHGAAAIAKLREWPFVEVERAVTTLTRSRGKLAEPPATGQQPGGTEWVDARAAEAAVMMHVHLALVTMRERSAAEAKEHARAALTVFEAIQAEAGRRQRRTAAEPRADAPRLHPRLDAAAFYAAFSEGCLTLGQPELADEVASRGVERAPTDARMLYVAGCVKETLAVMQTVYRRGEADAARRAAERLLRDSLAVAPDNLDARLRLARVLLDQERLVEAQPLLEQVTRSKDGRLRYLGWLFLGQLFDRGRNWSEAAEAYGRAMREQPDNQAARLGLAGVIEQQSGPVAARPLVLGTLSLSARPDRQADPWWSYSIGPYALASELLTDLGKRVSAP